ncbi:MAG: hypothetical protein CL608_02390 [Anaerolineaceae bacterium]|nr:hypothetical protein [Anaerolineaceae bacterium]
MEQELVVRLLMSIIFGSWIGYYTILSWISPAKFREMAKRGSVFYGNSAFMEAWIKSSLFINLMRIIGIIFTSAWLFVLLDALKKMFLK